MPPFWLNSRVEQASLLVLLLRCSRAELDLCAYSDGWEAQTNLDCCLSLPCHPSPHRTLGGNTWHEECAEKKICWASHASLERTCGEEGLLLSPSGPGEGFGAAKNGRTRARGDFRIGADRNDDTHGIVAEMRRIGATPHVAQTIGRSGGSGIDGCSTRHEGDAKSIHAQRGIEQVFGWIKTKSAPKESQSAGLRQFKLRGRSVVSAVSGLHVIACNMNRLGNLLRPVEVLAGTGRSAEM